MKMKKSKMSALKMPSSESSEKEYDMDMMDMEDEEDLEMDESLDEPDMEDDMEYSSELADFADEDLIAELQARGLLDEEGEDMEEDMDYEEEEYS